MKYKVKYKKYLQTFFMLSFARNVNFFEVVYGANRVSMGLAAQGHTGPGAWGGSVLTGPNRANRIHSRGTDTTRLAAGWTPEIVL